MINIDAVIADADWPKRTPDRLSDLIAPDPNAQAAALHEQRAQKYSPDQPRDERGRFGETGGGSLTAEQTAAIRGWTGGDSYRHIQVNPGSAEAKMFASAMAASPPVSGVVYRGIESKDETGRRLLGADQAAKVWSGRVGQSVEFHEPVSTSTDEHVAAGFGHVLLEIEQTGAARDIAAISDHPDEKE
ncbi:MAG: hypothetical protein ABSH20_30025, partial [Tepidisphaeraceae bacterium]